MAQEIDVGGGSGSQRIGAQTITNASTYDEISTIRRIGGLSILTVTGIVAGTGPLIGLKLSVSAAPSGTHKDRLVDGDFNTANRLLPFCTANPHTTASGSTFQFELDMTGVQEVRLFGKSANGATVALEVSW